MRPFVDLNQALALRDPWRPAADHMFDLAKNAIELRPDT